MILMNQLSRFLGEHRTRDGKKATVLSVEGRPEYPLLGATVSANGSFVATCSWTANGYSLGDGGESELDLIDIIAANEKPKTTPEVDWSKVNPGTIVEVSCDGEYWVLCYFDSLSSGAFPFWGSFSCSSHVHAWKYCRLPQPPTEKQKPAWCEHIEWKNRAWMAVQGHERDIGKLCVLSAWTHCPLCGKPKPKD